MNAMSKALYICDQKKCEDCSAAQGLCRHTSDITHAANFVTADGELYIETEVLRALNQDEDSESE